MDTAHMIDVKPLAAYVRVELNGERATVYAAGGISYDLAFQVSGNFGAAGRREWFVNDEPCEAIVRLARAVRAEAYPHLEPHTADVTG